MIEDEPVTRDEINRLWADLHALRILVCSDLGARLGSAGVDRWHETYSASNDRHSDEPAAAALMARAIDRLGAQLRVAAKSAERS